VRYTLADRTLQGRAAADGGAIGAWPLGCRGTALFAYGTTLLVGCDDGSVVQFSVKDPTSPEYLRTVKVERAVAGFELRDGKPFVLLVPPPTPTVAPASAPAPAAAAKATITPGPAKVAAPESPPRVRAYRGQVVARSPLVVVIDKGERDGVKAEDRVELYSLEEVDLGAGERTTRRKRHAVGRVTDVGNGRALVELDPREQVPVGAEAELAKLPVSASPLGPPRVGGLWELELNVRPFLAWQARGAGVLGDARATYRFKSPLALHLLAEPVGFGRARNGQIGLGATAALVSLDTRYFEAGLGAGWTMVAADLGESTLSVPQLLRAGAVDGVNLRVLNSFALLGNRWGWGGTNVRFQFPVWASKTRWWLVAGGGAGVAGYGYGEGGARVTLYGDGGKGSLFMTATFGYGQLKTSEVQRDCNVEVVDGEFCHGGPMAGIGFEWRPGNPARARRPKPAAASGSAR
jgi:hypothetical protein